MRMIFSLLIVLACWPIPLAAQDRGAIAFENVRILRMDGDRVVDRGYVIVEGSRIADFGQGDLPAEYDGKRLDFDGATIMPGLADMHVHHYETDIGVAYLANSITLVRNLTGSLQTIRRDQAALDGAIIGPRIRTSGPIIDGGKPSPNDFFIRVNSPNEVVGAVRSQARSGYDAVKLYEQLSADEFRAGVAEARANGMRVYAHVPESLTVSDLLEMQVDSLEHLDGYAEVMALEGFATDRKYAWAERWANADRAQFASLAERTKEAGTWMVPTFAITYGRIYSADPDAYFARPEARILPLWAQSWRGSAARYEIDRPFFERSLVEKIEFVSALRDAGANILIGTDAPNPFVTPGYAIHDELSAFQMAGYSNLEVLQLATVEAARFLQEEGRTGKIEAGAPADLVVLDGNPVDDLDVLRSPLGTMVAGNWHSREAISAALEKRAARIAELLAE